MFIYVISSEETSLLKTPVQMVHTQSQWNDWEKLQSHCIIFIRMVKQVEATKNLEYKKKTNIMKKMNNIYVLLTSK